MKIITIKENLFNFSIDNIVLEFWQSEIECIDNLLVLTRFKPVFLRNLGITNGILREMYEEKNYKSVYDFHLAANFLSFEFCFVAEGHENSECIGECEYTDICFYFMNCQK